MPVWSASENAALILSGHWDVVKRSNRHGSNPNPSGMTKNGARESCVPIAKRQALGAAPPPLDDNATDAHIRELARQEIKIAAERWVRIITDW